MKLFLLILTTLIINGCTQKAPDCAPVACEMLFPKLPTYKIPNKRAFTKPVALANGLYAVDGTQLKDVFVVNAKLRRACTNYAVVNKRVNAEYQ